MEIQWAEPPAHAVRAGQKPGRYVEFANVLRQHPGKWAVLPGDQRTEKGAKATAQNIRRGVTKGFPKDEYDTAVDGTVVYVMFVGPKTKALPPEEGEARLHDDEPDFDNPDYEGASEIPRNATLAPRVRAWAQKKGYDVPERGRLPQRYYEEYAEETGEEVPVRRVP